MFTTLIKQEFFLNKIIKYNIYIFKISNILLSKNEQKNKISIKIGDFGIGTQTEDYLRSFVGTPFYQSPELINNDVYTAKTDVW